MDWNAILNVAIGGGLATIAGGLWQVYLHRDKKVTAARVEGSAMEIHRDNLVMELVGSMRAENQAAKEELEDVKNENRALRALEKHFYHFEQAVDHLEAILFAETDAMRKVAEHNAKSFLARVKRMQEAKGKIQQELQVLESGARIDEAEGKT